MINGKKQAKDNTRLKHVNIGNENIQIAEYLDNTKSSRRFCQAQMEDNFSITWVDDKKTCKLCNETCDCPFNHIIKDCDNMINTTNTFKARAEEKGLKITANWSCEALKDTSRETGWIIELLNTWVESREEAEKETEITDK